MPLGQRAAQQIPSDLDIFCHTATMYWILQENAAGALDPNETVLDAAGLAPQTFFGDIQKSGTWDFTITPTTPPVGTVLYWPQSPTHTAIVTGPDQISGYNQNCVFATAPVGSFYATCAPDEIREGMTTCKTIGEDIALAAVALLG